MFPETQFASRTSTEASGPIPRDYEVSRPEQEFSDDWPWTGPDDGSTDKAKRYLEKGITSVVSYWARLWKGNPAGAESTQRVEKAHELLKSSLNSASALLNLHPLEERVCTLR